MTITERELTSHEDYESFAKYLGIDYDDYCAMISGVWMEEEDQFSPQFDKTQIC